MITRLTSNQNVLLEPTERRFAPISLTTNLLSEIRGLLISHLRAVAPTISLRKETAALMTNPLSHQEAIVPLTVRSQVVRQNPRRLTKHRKRLARVALLPIKRRKAHAKVLRLHSSRRSPPERQKRLQEVVAEVHQKAQAVREVR